MKMCDQAAPVLYQTLSMFRQKSFIKVKPTFLSGRLWWVIIGCFVLMALSVFKTKISHATGAAAEGKGKKQTGSTTEWRRRGIQFPQTFTKDSAAKTSVHKRVGQTMAIVLNRKMTRRDRKDVKTPCNREPAYHEAENVQLQLKSQVDAPDSCKNKAISICSVKIQHPRVSVECRHNLCKSCVFDLGIFDNIKGKLIWTGKLSCRQLETRIKSLLKTSHKELHHGFCVVRINSDALHLAHGVIKVQILLLPPQIHLLTNTLRKRRPSNSPNINIIMLDSLSRNHIFRTLPLSVKRLQYIKEDLEHKTKILDFKYFQSVKPRTHESLAMLFSGNVLEMIKSDVFSVDNVPSRSINASKLLLPLRRAGYRVLWMDDLCWKSEWGLGRHFAANTPGQSQWKDLKLKLMKEGVDEIGVSLINCEIFGQSNSSNPFQSALNLCLGSKSHQEYLFRYLKHYQDWVRRMRIPLFSFTMSNIAHEASGKRVQLLDATLADYLSTSAQADDTLTVILSDHGNTYGAYPENHVRGRIEIFNPFLFMIIPEGVQLMLEHLKLNVSAMLNNQNSLISALDLHLTLRSLIPLKNESFDEFGLLSEVRKHFPVNSNGLFQSIATNRSCADLPLLQPNLCICENYAIPRDTSSYYRLLGEFVLGLLNRKLLEKQRAINSWNVLYNEGPCPKLGSHKVANIMESHSAGKLLVLLDLHIHPWQSKDIYRSDVVLAAVEIADTGIRLISYERVTRYSEYEACTPPGFDAKLCLCGQRPNTSRPTISMSFHKALGHLETLGAPAEAHAVDTEKGHPCVHIIVRRHQAGAAFEIINSCQVGNYLVSFNLYGENVILSEQMPVIKRVEAGQVSFLAVTIQSAAHLNWSWSYTVDHVVLTDST